MSRPSRALVLLLPPLTAAMLGLSACSGSSESADAACTSEAAADTSAVPDDLDLESIGTITSASGSDGGLSAVVVADGDSKETVAAIADAVEGDGWKVTRREAEERDGEVFFTKGGRSAVAKADAGECDGQTVVEVTVSGG